MTLRDASISTIQKNIEHFLASDDVFSKDFLRFLVLVGTKTSSRRLFKDKKLNRYLLGLGITHLATVGRQLAEDAGLVDGPYMASVEGFHPVWKLFPDRQGAFVASVVQTMTGEYVHLTYPVPSYQHDSARRVFILWFPVTTSRYTRASSSYCLFKEPVPLARLLRT